MGYIFFLVAEFVEDGNVDGFGSARLIVDGQAVSGQGHALMDFDADLGTVAQVYRVDLPAGTHTIDVYASSSKGGGALWRWHTSLSWFSVAQ